VTDYLYSQVLTYDVAFPRCGCHDSRRIVWTSADSVTSKVVKLLQRQDIRALVFRNIPVCVRSEVLLVDIKWKCKCLLAFEIISTITVLQAEARLDILLLLLYK
jgi:hypothetical protein